MTVEDWVQAAAASLAKAGVDSPKLDAQLLLAHHLGWSRSRLLAHAKESFEKTPALEESLRRRVAREPLAYILGYREFFGRKFLVTPTVLIPRPETELLVEMALEESFHRALDVGTGSGCLAVTLKAERPDCRVEGTDISKDALKVARQNAERHKTHVAFSEADLWPPGRDKFDLIVSNPPYVAHQDPLAPEIAMHEPKLALYAEEVGLAVYRRMAKEARPWLAKGGRLILEVGQGQAGKVAELFVQETWPPPRVVLDFSGVERALLFQLP
ncbi:MAG: peptide chain release factor N(5)-glutamine methyltransferase [Fimbriimonadaceae bacterium]